MNKILTTRGEENFKKWKMVVGLPEHFPELRPISDEELENKTFVGPRIDKIEDIDLTIGVPLICVIIEKGHGASTLCRYVFRMIQRDSLKRKIIPVNMHLDQYWKSEDFKINLETMIKKGIVYHLVSEPWEKALFKPEYYNVIGAFDRKDVLRHKAEIWSEVEKPSVNWKKIEELCPFFARSIEEILTDLVKKFGLKVVLFFDIPFDAKVPEGASREEYVDFLAAHVKDLYEMYNIPEGALSEIYFLTNDDLDLIKAKWPREPKLIEFGAWAFNEIFAILAGHYKPVRTFPRTEPENSLAVVLSDKFLELVWDKNKTLHEIINDVRTLIVDRLDVDWKDAPYRLEMSPDQIKKWGEYKKRSEKSISERYGT